MAFTSNATACPRYVGNTDMINYYRQKTHDISNMIKEAGFTSLLSQYPETLEKSHLTGTLAVKRDLDCPSDGDKWPDAKWELWELWFYLGSVGPESSLM